MRAAAAVLALIVTASGAAAADAQRTGRVSAQVGLKAATGGFAARLGLGWAIGFEAAYQPLRPDQSIGLGLSWSTTWAYYGADSARVADSLSMIELAAGVRARVPLGARRRPVLFLGGGLALTRANEPPALDGERSYVGPWAAAGIEDIVAGKDLWLPPIVDLVLRPVLGDAEFGLEVRYVVSSIDDGTIGLLLSISYGS